MVSEITNALKQLKENELSKATPAKIVSESYKLSNEVDDNGKPFVLSSDGSTVYGEISEDIGLPPAPIKLSIGESVLDDNGRSRGYGLLHIEDNHGNQIRKAGFPSVEAFVETIAKKYETIREGCSIGDKQTYLLEVFDRHNNTLFVQLSNDGTYWNVNSAGIFRERYSRRKPKVLSLPEVGSNSNTEVTEVNRSQNKGVTATNGNSSKTSESKNSALKTNIQE